MNIFYIILIVLILSETKEDDSIYNLRVNHLKKPLGIDIRDNIFSFLSTEKGPFKASLLLGNEIIDTKEVFLNQSHSFYFKEPFEYNKTYKYIIESSSSKSELEFETAIKLSAPFIKSMNKTIFSPIFLKDFDLTKKVKKGRLYITGLGIYVAYINEQKVGNAYLTPGYNDYDYYLRYQTYDITELLKEKNKMEIHMGEGWYKGRFHWFNNTFGDEYKLCLHIMIEYEDGSIVNILSDDSWKVKNSKQVANSIYDGEVVDYTLPENPIEDVIISEKENYTLIPDFGLLIVEKDILYPDLYISPKGEQILDFKQNMVGFVRFKGILEKNQEMKMNHGEVLQEECFYNLNYRTSKSLLKYKGDGEKRIYEPKFTFFGFRYVLVEGIDKVDPNDFEGVVLYTNLEKTIGCKTDSKKINQLIHNAYWGQRGNFLDVPTDCPQRDERLGWTGDTQVFVNTACYNMDSYLFYRKYMHDLRGDQILYFNGSIAAYSPSLKKQAMNGGAVWSDAGTIIPWNLYQNYGDKNLLKYFYPMMRDYIEVLIKQDKEQGNLNLILEGETFGDWLAQDGENQTSRYGGTNHGFIMSVYYYHSANLISQAAKELGNDDDYEKYNELKNKIYEAILNKFFSKDGKLNLYTQTSYILCLKYKIYRNKDIIIDDLKKRIKEDLYRLKTGFTGTPLILMTLFDNGMDDYAYRILYNEEFPGWLYTINLGATTIWERWNSLLENGTISGTDMNSFNHYAYGSVCESIYSRIAGLRNLGPGWKKVMIKPHLNYRMKSIDFYYRSISGKYEISWNWNGIKFEMNVVIPNGCSAQIILPNGDTHNATSGRYYYEIELDESVYSPFSIDTPIIDLIKNKEASELIKDLLPQIYIAATEGSDGFKVNSIRSANLLPNFLYSDDTIKKINKELS
ncbi:MAG: family 78 glycoside hydrolase catalytic domain, partial [Clostridia bacterium]|nr:family 78 glycoside hydrolase catalytic domain [Clostridia bacterium]